MLYNAFHNHALRLLTAIFAQAVSASAMALLIVPAGFYSGGIMGVSQLIRSLVLVPLGIVLKDTDTAGILNLFLNIPILAVAWKMLGRGFMLRTIACVAVYSFVYSLIPIPAEPYFDALTSCLLGGTICGVCTGITLTCGCSGGGLDVIGLCLGKSGSSWSVGRFSIGFNLLLYSVCALAFRPATAIYSAIFLTFSALVMDRVHQQNVNAELIIITRDKEEAIAAYIHTALGRGATCVNASGTYTGGGMKLLLVCCSKFEVEELLRSVRRLDPHAFVIETDEVRVLGNFPRRLEEEG